MPETAHPRFAVLIDADNVPPWLLKCAIPDIRGRGRIVVCRIFGNLPETLRPGWRAEVEGGRLPSARFVHQTGRNAADRALKKEAVRLAHGGGLDGVCLLSSDGGFAGLARRLRARGLAVHVYGRQATKSLQREASGFHHISRQPRPLQ